MSRRDMGGKKPSNGSNTADRRSNLRSKGKKWKEQLVQGVKEKELSDALNQKLDAQRQLIRNKKIQLKNEAKQLDIELGFVDASTVNLNRKVPEWKRQKNFLNAVFPPPVICRKYKNIMVYRNKLAMQEYWHRVVSPEEWEANLELLNEMRAIYDAENPEQQGITNETNETNETEENVEENEEGEGSGDEEVSDSEDEGSENENEVTNADEIALKPTVNEVNEDEDESSDVEGSEGSDVEGSEVEGSGDESEQEGPDSQAEVVVEGVSGLKIA